MLRIWIANFASIHFSAYVCLDQGKHSLFIWLILTLWSAYICVNTSKYNFMLRVSLLCVCPTYPTKQWPTILKPGAEREGTRLLRTLLWALLSTLGSPTCIAGARIMRKHIETIFFYILFCEVSIIRLFLALCFLWLYSFRYEMEVQHSLLLSWDVIWEIDMRCWLDVLFILFKVCTINISKTWPQFHL